MVALGDEGASGRGAVPARDAGLAGRRAPLTDGAHRVDGTFDLARDPVSHEWLLLGVFDDQIDQQLFA
ncbi:hypothetical protein GCM10025867_32020 [Frondihabitans sucicola]|uniref:Uncharacterized protein n=1 Tax=Frondihabitans sucicola TaxID=1268041 RepID=A0ABN6Y1P9_9MICO|nr:hypothetical protein GCM10025867_32020 [Frondihabitans sucicola]